MGKADYIDRAELLHVLALLTPANRLAMEISLATGLRISDVLALRSEQLAPRMRVREAKTRKMRTVRLPADLLRRARQMSDLYPWSPWVFGHRLDPDKHRTRQAVWSDLQRAARAIRLPKGLQCSPHSARKGAAVALYRRTGDLARVQTMCNHDRPETTMLYALADVLTARKAGRLHDRYRPAQQNGASARKREKMAKKPSKTGDKP